MRKSIEAMISMFGDSPKIRILKFGAFSIITELLYSILRDSAVTLIRVIVILYT